MLRAPGSRRLRVPRGRDVRDRHWTVLGRKPHRRGIGYSIVTGGRVISEFLLAFYSHPISLFLLTRPPKPSRAFKLAHFPATHDPSFTPQHQINPIHNRTYTGLQNIAITPPDPRTYPHRTSHKDKEKIRETCNLTIYSDLFSPISQCSTQCMVSSMFLQPTNTNKGKQEKALPQGGTWGGSTSRQ